MMHTVRGWLVAERRVWLVLGALLGLVLFPAIAFAAHPAGTYLANSADFASTTAADWSNATTVRVELGEFFFEPSDLTFEAGKPYKVQLVNIGAVKHEFTAGDFFASVAWRKAESAESEVKLPFFTEIEVFAGKQVDLYFVPITPGTYELVCEIEGHLAAGMKGTITVTGAAPTSPAPQYMAISSGAWIADGAARVSAADWAKMQTVVIDMNEFSFAPKQTTLDVGTPYKIQVKNSGAVKHEATASEFFQSVAFRKAEDASGEFKGPVPLEVEVFAGKQTDLYLIPTRAGTFELLCEIEGHREAGMFATIVVREAAVAPAPAAQQPPAPASTGNAGMAAGSGGLSPVGALLLTGVAAALIAASRAATGRRSKV